MENQIKGTIKLINPTNTVSEKFKKREFVIKTNSTYPQEVQLECTQDNCSLLDGFQPGEIVNVSININGRCWTNNDGIDKYFNTLVAWKIERISEEITPVATAQVPPF